MKRFIGIFLAAFLLLSVLSVTVFAADNIAFVAYNKGNDSNTITDTVEVLAAEKDNVPHVIEVEKGSYLFIAPALKDKFIIKGEGNVIDYVDGYSEIVGNRLGDKKFVELTIGSPVAFINYQDCNSQECDYHYRY